MESTLLESFLRAGKLKPWLAKPDCLPVIKECKLLFAKIYAPKVSDGAICDNSSTDESFEANVPVKYTCGIPNDLHGLSIHS